MNRYGFLGSSDSSITQRLDHIRVVERDGVVKTTKAHKKHLIYSSLDAPAMVCYEPSMIEKKTRIEHQKMIDDLLELGYDYTKNPANADIVIIPTASRGYNVKKPMRGQNVQIIPEHMFFAKGK